MRVSRDREQRFQRIVGWGSSFVRRGVIVVNCNEFPSYSTLVPRAVDDKLSGSRPRPRCTFVDLETHYCGAPQHSWINNISILGPMFGICVLAGMLSFDSLWRALLPPTRLGNYADLWQVRFPNQLTSICGGRPV